MIEGDLLLGDDDLLLLGSPLDLLELLEFLLRDLLEFLDLFELLEHLLDLESPLLRLVRGGVSSLLVLDPLEVLEFISASVLMS